MSLHIITHVVPYLRSIMHMHFYCYLTGGTAYLLDWESECCYSEVMGKYFNLIPVNLKLTTKFHLKSNVSKGLSGLCYQGALF